MSKKLVTNQHLIDMIEGLAKRVDTLESRPQKVLFGSRTNDNSSIAVGKTATLPKEAVDYILFGVRLNGHATTCLGVASQLGAGGWSVRCISGRMSSAANQAIQSITFTCSEDMTKWTLDSASQMTHAGGSSHTLSTTEFTVGTIIGLA